MNKSDAQSYAIYHDLWIDSPVEKVFQAVSNPSELINWWPKACKGDSELDGIYNFFFTPDFDWYGKVIQYQENQSFHIKMTDSDEDWDPTTFGFDLNRDSGKTKVNFWHTGWPSCNDHFKRSSFCWAILLQGLKNYVESGTIVPFEDRA